MSINQFWKDHGSTLVFSFILAAIPVTISGNIIHAHNSRVCEEAINQVRRNVTPISVSDATDICSSRRMRTDGLTYPVPIWLFWGGVMTFVGVGLDKASKEGK